MRKSLSARIAQHMKNKPCGHTQNRATFSILWPEVEQALRESWPIRNIWETLYEEGKVTFGYQAFRRYVNQRIPAPKPVSPPIRQATYQTQQQQKPTQIPGFTYNPNPDKKDLF